ncbi:MAG TPA: NADH-quinone oxidoreductase subunit C, partial [Planctomycetota bacterium]|nr:NADH-quinone oxidoreductase subunit C [Planctomycetota bacterium]
MISDLRGESAFGPVASRAGDERLPATTGELTGILISSRVPVEPLGIRSLRDATDGFEGAVRVPREHLLPVLDLLRRHVGPALGLVDLTALDERDDAGAGERFSVVLLLRAHDTGAEIEIRVAVPADDTLAPSTTSVFSSARILEREVHDLFGIELDGHPDLRRLLLPEDYPGFPLRRDASPEGPQVARADLGAGREPIAPAVLRAVERDGAILIDLDVEHPTPRGAFRLALAVEDGAMGSGRALAADVEIGFLHQGIEKLAESIRLSDLDRLFDSLRAIDALPSRHAVALALEALAGIEAPA